VNLTPKKEGTRSYIIHLSQNIKIVNLTPKKKERGVI